MNAMTYDDHTSYPISSTIPRDLLNLMDVYCDSVFHPLLRLNDFLQEGWRLENGIIKGVVFNEMKGYQADQSRSLFKAVSSAYLKDTNYEFVSGGEPLSIPSLSYPDLLSFHHNHYHPTYAIIIKLIIIHHSYLEIVSFIPMEIFILFITCISSTKLFSIVSRKTQTATQFK